MDYYVVLGIAEDADQEAIRTRFRALARRYHPDVGAGSSPVEFQRAREAYETLVDPERRHRYDEQLRASRVERDVVRELIVWTPFAEPVYDPGLAFDLRRARGANTASSIFEDVYELVVPLDNPWSWVRRWR